MGLSTIINRHMHEGSCPGAGSLGECPAIWLRHSNATHGHYSAAVYLWPAAADLKFAEVARWFSEATGLPDEEVLVELIVHDTWNDTREGLCSDGARPLSVSFSLDLAKAEELGMELPKEPAGPEASPRLSAAELMGVRTVAPHLPAALIEEIAVLPVDKLQLRLIGAISQKPLTAREVHDLSCMQAGAPWMEPTLSGLVECIAIYDGLRMQGLRPADPADGPPAADAPELGTQLDPTPEPSADDVAALKALMQVRVNRGGHHSDLVTLAVIGALERARATQGGAA